MGDTLISAIIMAVISSLAFIAYKHPTGYRKMYGPLCVLDVVIMFVCCAYSVGYENGFFDSSSHHPKNHDLIPAWAWIGLLVFVVYLAFLLFVPYILNLPIKDPKEHNPKSKVSEKGSDNDA